MSSAENSTSFAGTAQRTKVRPLRTALLLLALLSFSATSGLAAPLLNERCPVEPNEIALERYQTDYRGVTISFCCSTCVEEFESSPESYLAALPADLEYEEDASTERGPALRAFDAVWNAGVRTLGLIIGSLVIISLLIARYLCSKFAPRSKTTRWARAVTSGRSLVILLLLSLAGEVASAHYWRIHDGKELRENELIDRIHYTVFTEYGDPPTPSRPRRDPSVASVFYRGNDERNPALFNGGNYRTTEFHLDLCDTNGKAIGVGDPAKADDLLLRVRFDRSPGTNESFWTPERMAKIYATNNAGKFHGRDEPVGDAVAMEELKTGWSWQFTYPLSAFAGTENGPRRGIVYLCERRLNEFNQTLGGRFHYAFQFDLMFENGALSPASDLWMGPLYRKRDLRIWEIPEKEWLGSEPIPTIPEGESSDDKRLLGIE